MGFGDSGRAFRVHRDFGLPDDRGLAAWMQKTIIYAFL
jgi:hypothetical protein